VKRVKRWLCAIDLCVAGGREETSAIVEAHTAKSAKQKAKRIFHGKVWSVAPYNWKPKKEHETV